MAKRRHGSLGSANTSLVRTIISTDEDHQIENSDDITIATRPVVLKMPRHPYVGEVVQVVADKFEEKHEKHKKLHIHGHSYPINGGNIELPESSTVTLTFSVHKEWIPSGTNSLCAEELRECKEKAEKLRKQLATCQAALAACEGENLQADYVIVGLGTAGAPLARYLSENMITSVVVLEAGEDESTDPAILQGAPFGNLTIANNPRFSWTRLTTPGNINVGLSGVNNYSDGRMWGGGSGHNGIVAVRGTPDVYDNAWAPINPQWSYNNLLPIMKFMETYTPNGTVANPAQRGFSGPLFITQDPPLPANHFYSDLSTATNAPANSDYNDPSLGDVGVDAMQWFVTPVTNQRSWSQSAFLPPSILTTDSNGNGVGTGTRKLRVMSRSTATELLIDNTGSIPKVTGVRFVSKNSPEKALNAFAAKKVILCAGTIANAALLQLSGIGPAALLASLGIPVVVNSPNVGMNKKNHYGPIGLIQQDPLNPIPFQVGQANIDLSGNVAGGYNLTAGGVGVPPAQVQPNDSVRRFQLNLLPSNGAIPHAILTALGIQNVPGVSVVTFNFIPQATGNIVINSKDPLTMPSIQDGYYQDVITPTDLDRTVAMYKVMANIAVQYGQPMLYPPMSHYPAPFGTAPDDSLLIQDAKDVTLIAAYHNVGTCRMGTSIATGVVDGNLDVFGIQNLACCDNSVIPTNNPSLPIHKGNTAYPAYILGLQKAKIEGAATPF